MIPGSIESLTRRLGNYKQAGTQEFRFDCPICPKHDSKGHLHVNPYREKWICFKCGSKGNLPSLFKILGIPTPSFQTYDEDSFFASLLRYCPQIGSLQSPLTYPCDVRPITKSSSAWHYLRARGFRDDTADFYKLVWGTYQKADRIFFPTFSPDSGEMIFWVARKFQAEEPDSEKYVNPVEGNRCIFNLDKAKDFTTVIITEGPTSAIAVGKNGVATFGKVIMNDQKLLLASYDFEEYIVALDGDARQEALDLVSFFVQAGKNVSLIPFKDGQDPASVHFGGFYARRVKCDNICDIY